MKNNLILHCGANTRTIEDIRNAATPRPSATWTPIPHATLVDTVSEALVHTGLEIVGSSHSLSHGGDRYFGLMEVRNPNRETPKDYSFVLGLRNSHDKTFPAGLVAGAQVFVCDNLSFSGEVKVARKHTHYILRDLPRLVSGAVGQLSTHWTKQAERIEAYKCRDLTDIEVHDLVVRASDVGVVSNRSLPDVLKEWRKPSHEEFAPRNTWSLFNAFTETLKDASLGELPRRTQRLHGLLDAHCGLN